MKKIFALISILLLLGVVFISGCTSNQTTIKSEEDVGRSLDNVSQSVEKISGILKDVDSDLGGESSG